VGSEQRLEHGHGNRGSEESDPREGCGCPRGQVGSPCAGLASTTRFLPPSHALAPCNPGAADRALDVITRAMAATVPCDDPKQAELHHLPFTGVGAIMMYVAYGVGLALQKGRTFSVPDRSMLGWAPASCGGGSPRCYLEPFSSCSIGKATGTGGAAGGATGALGAAGRKPSGPEDKKTRRELWLTPAVVASGVDSFFAYHSQIMRYTWRLNTRWAAQAETVKRNAGWPNAAEGNFTTGSTRTKIIAMHVRHGDACAAKRRTQMYGCPQLAHYMHVAFQMRARYGAATIYLATDDPKVETDIRDNTTYPGWTILSNPDVNREWYQPSAWHKYGRNHKGAGAKHRSDPQFQAGFVEKRLRAGDGDPERLGAEAVMDIELLSGCDMFIGTLSSTLGRTAFEVMAGRLGYVPPFASLDRHGWFYAQGKCREGGNETKVSCPKPTWISGKTHGGA